MPLASRVALWIKRHRTRRSRLGRQRRLPPPIHEGILGRQERIGDDRQTGRWSTVSSNASTASASGELALGVDGDGWWLDRFQLVASEPAESEAQNTDEITEDFSTWKVSELAAALRERGITPAGNKAELVELMMGNAS
jgi:hypothetical protein